MIVVYSGRRPSDDGGQFPDRQTAFVRERLDRLLAGLRPRLAVGSAAAGADLLAADAALNAGAAADIVLAGKSDPFRAGSVSDKGDNWTAAYDGLMRRDRVTVTELPATADDDGYAAVNRALLDRATAALNPDEELVVIVVSAGRRPGRDHTEQLAEEAVAAGHLVVRVDPTIGRDEVPIAFVAMPYGCGKTRYPGARTTTPMPRGTESSSRCSSTRECGLSGSIWRLRWRSSTQR